MMNKAAIKFGAGEPDGQDKNDGVIAWNVWAPGLNIVGKGGIDKQGKGKPRHTQIWGTVDTYQDVSFPHVSCTGITSGTVSCTSINSGSVTCTGAVYTHTIDADSLKGHAWNATGHIYLPQGLIMRQSNGYEIRIWDNKISLMAPNGVEIPTGTLNTATIENSGAITAWSLNIDALYGRAWGRSAINCPNGMEFRHGDEFVKIQNGRGTEIHRTMTHWLFGMAWGNGKKSNKISVGDGLILCTDGQKNRNDLTISKNKVTAHSIKSHNIYTHIIDTDQLKGHAWNRAGHIYTPQGIKFKGG